MKNYLAALTFVFSTLCWADSLPSDPDLEQVTSLSCLRQLLAGETRKLSDAQFEDAIRRDLSTRQFPAELRRRYVRDGQSIAEIYVRVFKVGDSPEPSRFVGLDLNLPGAMEARKVIGMDLANRFPKFSIVAESTSVYELRAKVIVVQRRAISEDEAIEAIRALHFILQKRLLKVEIEDGVEFDQLNDPHIRW